MLVQAQVENTSLGYIVSVYYAFDGRSFHWYRLCNFGESQGDARFYMLYRVPALLDSQIRYLIKNYNPQRIYKI